MTKQGQADVLRKLGCNKYFKLPKQGTNPRGVEITNEAINLLAKHKTTMKLEIDWQRDKSIEYNAYDRWLDHWKEK